MLKGYRGRNRGCEKIASIEHALSIVTLTLLNLIGSPFLHSPRDGKVVVIISQLDMETNWAKIDVKIVFASSKFRKPNSNSEDTRHPSLILRQTYEEGYPPILLGLLKRGEQGASTLIERVGRELDGCF